VTDAAPAPLLLQTSTGGSFIDTYIGYPDKRTIASGQSRIPEGYEPTLRLSWLIFQAARLL